MQATSDKNRKNACRKESRKNEIKRGFVFCFLCQLAEGTLPPPLKPYYSTRPYLSSRGPCKSYMQKHAKSQHDLGESRHEQPRAGIASGTVPSHSGIIPPGTELTRLPDDPARRTERSCRRTDAINDRPELFPERSHHRARS